MSTATKKSRASGPPKRSAGELRIPASMEFLIFEDNGGNYHWTIVAGDGATLVRSASFASYEDAERAANHVRTGAASARFERRAGGATPVDLTVWRSAATDDADAERWLDEGGSFSSEAVARW